MSIEALGPPPPDPTNRVADDRRAANLGRRLFSDARLSANGKVSCASCHDPSSGFTDRFATGRGISVGTRRTMPIMPAVYSTWQFWDGRSDSVWSQALGPLENPAEHGFTRGEVVDLIVKSYRHDYEQIFGAIPPLSVGRASPTGDAASRQRWGKLSPDQQRQVDEIFANAGKAIASFERTQRFKETRFDQYVNWLVGGQSGRPPLTESEVIGLRVFLGKARCSTCHSGPLFSNGEFANTGVPDARLDKGRANALSKVLADPFNCRGAYNDSKSRKCDELEFLVLGSADQIGAFKVPSLRGVAQRPPYMHAGQIRSLKDVVRHYERASPASIGRSQLQAFTLTPDERRSLVAFLGALTSSN